MVEVISLTAFLSFFSFLGECASPRRRHHSQLLLAASLAHSASSLAFLATDLGSVICHGEEAKRRGWGERMGTGGGGGGDRTGRVFKELYLVGNFSEILVVNSYLPPAISQKSGCVGALAFTWTSAVA